MTPAVAAGCLAGVRVLDLSQYLPGPYAGQILADLGAEVVKVEPPAGDPMRAMGPLDSDGISAFYKLINAGKTVVHLDLKSAAGTEDFAALLSAADVLFESFRPGVLARLGFADDRLRALNSRLVHCCLSGFGRDGPSAQLAGHDITYMALAGGLATSGIPERPVMAHPPTADFASGLQAALAIVAALLRRAATGQGAAIDVSIAESVLAWQGVVLTAARRPGHETGRAVALLNGGSACYQIYATGDGRFVALGALERKFWAAFCRAVKRDDWIARQDDPLPQHALIAEVAQVMRSRPLSHWQRKFEGVDCCFQPVLEPAEVLDHPHIQGRGLVYSTDGPDPYVHALYPALFDGLRPAPRPPLREAPAERILQSWANAPSPA